MSDMQNNPNLNVLFDMLNSTDSNYSFFASSKLESIAKML